MTKKSTKSKTPAKKPAARKTPVVTTASREQQNGITRPGADTLCGKVWAVLDRLHAKNEDATFTTAREALKNEKMADATVRTQTQRWREFNGITRDAKKPASKPKPVAAKAAPVVSKTEEVQPAA